MKLNRIYLPIVAAVAAVAALAVPASATPGEWLHEGKPFAEKVEMPLTGGDFVEIGKEGEDALLCQSSALTITTEGGSSGTASYEVTPGSCMGLSGRLAGCSVTAAEATGSWSLAVNTTDVTAKGVKVTYSLNAGCAIETIEVNFPELTLKPQEEASSIKFFQWNASGSGKVDGEAATIGYFGTQSYSEAQSGKFGIG